MKTVRVASGIVQEIIPDYAHPVDRWYGEAFAAQCHEAPDEVETGWIYDEEAGTFAPPAELEPPAPQLTTEEIMLDMITDLEYRTSLLELGIGGAL